MYGIEINQNTILLVVVVFAVIVAIYANSRRKIGRVDKSAVEYHYTRKQFIMTKTENEFYHALQQAIGTSYMIYPQAHLDTFLDHKVKGQDWRAALSKIQRKSVDFLICNREYYNPLVAIELDDASHENEDRRARDEKVEAICREAEMPLVRLRWQHEYNTDELLRLVAPYLK